MALIDRSQAPWAVIAGLGLAAGLSVYVWDSRNAIDGPSGSTAVGLGFGIAAATIMIFETLLNVRKRFPTLSLGYAETWLKGHIWFGLLIVPFVFFHSGFRLSGTLAVTLTVVVMFLIVSGVYGLALQQFLPRTMSQQAPGETVYEQIPHVVRHLQLEAYEVAASVCGPMAEAADEARALQAREDAKKGVERRGTPMRMPMKLAGSDDVREFYLDEVRPFLHGDGRSGKLAQREARQVLIDRSKKLELDLHEAIKDLVEIAGERSDLAVQRRMHHWLHGWLFLHVPLTAAALVLLVAHVVLALRYAD